MMIDIKLDINQLDSIVRAWLKETLKSVQYNAAAHYVHPDDVKQYRKDIKALKRILDYIGEGE
jgi:flagellar biosynthesis/type III secretory pathway protein FliH